jgi:hypothetical protein
MGRPAPEEASLVFRIRQADRTGASEASRKGRGQLAFLKDRPEGTGFDVTFTANDAFILALGLDLLRMGFVQSEVVMLMNVLRPCGLSAIELAPSDSCGSPRLPELGQLTRQMKPIYRPQCADPITSSSDTCRRGQVEWALWRMSTSDRPAACGGLSRLSQLNQARGLTFQIGTLR